MLGRHVYRVRATDGNWIVCKEGEDDTRGHYVSQGEAMQEACRLADADQPSRVIVDNGDGVILEERLFGADLAQELNDSLR